MNVFVYGTLMQGMYNNRILSEFDYTSEPAFIYGYDMYDVGQFPALVKSTEKSASYLGELLSFEDEDAEAVLRVLDMLEGFLEKSPSSSMYVREEVEVWSSSNDQPVKTYIYIWNRTTDGLRLIPHDLVSYPNYRNVKFIQTKYPKYPAIDTLFVGIAEVARSTNEKTNFELKTIDAVEIYPRNSYELEEEIELETEKTSIIDVDILDIPLKAGNKDVYYSFDKDKAISWLNSEYKKQLESARFRFQELTSTKIKGI